MSVDQRDCIRPEGHTNNSLIDKCIQPDIDTFSSLTSYADLVLVISGLVSLGVAIRLAQGGRSFKEALLFIVMITISCIALYVKLAA